MDVKIQQLENAIRAFASSRIQYVRDGLESPYFAALLVEKYCQGIVDAVKDSFDARGLIEIGNLEIDKIDPDYHSHSMERYRSYADVSFEERNMKVEL